MILGIVGTSGTFPRLVEALAHWKAQRPESEVWVQHGGMTLPPGLEGAALTSREDVLEKLKRAEAVVCHAGTGTLFDVLGAGHVPVVMARRHHLREHVNDHQLEIVAALREVDRVIEVKDASEVVAAIEEAMRRKGEGSVATGEGLVHALQQEIASVVPKRRWAFTRVLRFLEPRTYPR